MALSWALAGICSYARTTGHHAETRSMARRLAEQLLENQHAESGLFFASARREGWLRRRKPEATLSSQTYPMIGLVSCATTFDDPPLIDAARRCAATLCRLQGPDGQWWWRYDVRRGSVTAGYPVYSVNQDSAMPAALGLVDRAANDRRFAAAIERGYGWLDGRNETGSTLIDEAGGTVARSVDVSGTRVSTSWELFAYQPARFLWAILSNPDLNEVRS
jgi:hypothetical protein